jgi:hypothetical protein
MMDIHAASRRGPAQSPDFFHMKPLSGICLIPSFGQRYGQTIGGKHTAVKAANSFYANSIDCSKLAFVFAWSENFKKRHSYPCALTICVVGFCPQPSVMELESDKLLLLRLLHEFGQLILILCDEGTVLEDSTDIGISYFLHQC